MGEQRDPEEFDLARRHVLQGRKIVTAQRRLIERLRGMGCDTTEAERTLDLFMQSLTMFDDHLKRLLNAPRGGPHFPAQVRADLEMAAGAICALGASECAASRRNESAGVAESRCARLHLLDRVFSRTSFGRSGPGPFPPRLITLFGQPAFLPVHRHGRRPRLYDQLTNSLNCTGPPAAISRRLTWR
jgi:hypothetical protein